MFSPNNPDPLYTVGQTISAVESGLAIMAACIPDLLPLVSRYFPTLMGISTRGNTPNYANGYASASRNARNGYVVSNNINTNRSVGGGDDYEMPNMKWRNDQLTKGEVQIKGGASQTSLHGSEEAIIVANAVPEKGRIVKTTHFVVEEADDEDKRWSNV